MGQKLVLSDRSIKEALADGRIVIDPLDENDIQPASVDLHLGRTLLAFTNSRRPYVDLREDVGDLTEELALEDDDPFMLHPGEFILGSTMETIHVPDDLVASLEGKSSLGRVGLVIHSTAGYVDPGWQGTLTLELTNVSRLPITLYYGMRIGQISFQRMTTPVDRPYGHKDLGSRHFGATGPTATRVHLDFDEKRAR